MPLMCVAPGSFAFIIVLLVFAVVTVVCGFTLWRFVKAVSAAKSETAIAETVIDHLSALIVNGLWFMIVILAGQSCGFF